MRIASLVLCALLATACGSDEDNADAALERSGSDVASANDSGFIGNQSGSRTGPGSDRIGGGAASNGVVGAGGGGTAGRAAMGPGGAAAGTAAGGGSGEVDGGEGAPIDFDRLPEVTPADFEVSVAGVERSERVTRPRHVRGLYVNSWSAGSTRRLGQLIDLANRTEINSFVVDVKDVTGHISYESSVPLAQRIGANGDIRIGSIRNVLARLKENGIYPIARIVVFKDPLLALARPDWAIQTADQRVWRDHNGEIWVDSYNRHVWDYNLALAREAVELGFAEVQWDYVRFPDVPSRYMRTANYPAREGRTRSEAIREFLQYSSEELSPLGVDVTADVFGVTTSAGGDVGIGQHWESMTDVADVLLPMVYPSHYRRGSFGIPYPNADPYNIIRIALQRGVARNQPFEDPAIIRPWLQDFTLGQPPYGPAHVRAQIEATYDVGLHEWILWNPSSRYTVGALANAEGEVPYIEGLAALMDPDGVHPDSIPLAIPPDELEPLPLGEPIQIDL